jgi:hypothetical protein
MGTRGLIGYYSKGVTKATYNHFDSYPKCLGEEVREYIADRTARELYEDFLGIRLVQENKEVTPEDVIAYTNFWYGDVGRHFINGDLREEQGWYDLLRERQGDFAAYAEIGLMIDGISFIKDSLYCEWAYIINLDRGVLEVYRGFQEKKPKKNRYALSKEEIAVVKAEKGYYVRDLKGKRTFHKNQYYNCDLIAQIPLEDVPDFDMSQFQDIVYSTEDTIDAHVGSIIPENRFGTEAIRSTVQPEILTVTGVVSQYSDTSEQHEPYFWQPKSQYEMTVSVITGDKYLEGVFA